MSAELEKRIEELEKEVMTYRTVLNEMAVPIIESVMPHTLLMPLTGHIYKERIQLIDETLYAKIVKNRDVRSIIIDFTGQTLKDYRFIELSEFSASLKNLNELLKLLGIRTLYCGFSPELVFELVRAGFTIEIDAYPTYRAAVEQLVKDTNYTIAQHIV
ncbi:hypothetical protein [Kurthia sibirica]|uniref:Histidine kinase n=1 Tax=Kurthia sibirica TaxID=202750 RepID=A0A2U3AIK4_9BACL|nr:hypothetical protein [Kurthia sibirica]PWI24386.1 hypothetical protein DEX24_13700 [Kurthia sibirica]GEK33803.1 hypothetical protein KSI01_13360 [Kurthia sibirica]